MSAVTNLLLILDMSTCITCKHLKDERVTLRVLLATAITAGAVAQGTTGTAADASSRSEGSEYIIALLGQTIQSETSVSRPDITYKVVVSGEGGVNVTFTTVDWNKTASIEDGGSTVELFKLKDSLNGTEIANKSIKVSSNRTVTVQVFTYASEYVEGYLALPVASLNVLYQVSTFCSLSGYCQIAIASTVPGITKVYLQFPLRVPEIVFCIGKKFYRSKRDRFFKLAEFEVLQIETAADLTGTYIFSEHPVAVFAGTRNLTVGGAITHMVEQLAPAHTWGKEFVLKTLGNTAYGDIIKITAIHSKTTVNMKGFSSFVIANSNHTVSRLLKNGTLYHIKSDKAIQVIQFAGLTNNITDDAPSFSPSMTVVPPTSSYEKEFLHSCNRQDTAYILALPKLESSNILINEHGLQQTPEEVIYSSYSLVKESFDASDDVTQAKTSGDMPFGGVLICGKTAIMPMSLGLKIPKEEKKEACKEDLTFDVQVDVRRPVQIPHKLEGIRKIDLIKLRVQTCGHAGVILERNQTRVILNIMHKKVVVTRCEPHCKNTSVYENVYNDVSDRNCTVDMSFFWIRQYRKPDKKVCLGYGPYQDDDCEQKLITGKTFQTMKLTGFSGSVHFNYDLHVGECDKTISDWRCQDLADNCDLYEESVCSDPHFGEWVMKNCRKYCGKCHPDVYGRRFLVLVPEKNIGGLSECEIHVTALAPDTRIAVGSKENVIVSSKAVYIESAGSIATIYDCGPFVSTTPITVISDKTVFVTVVFVTSFPGITSHYGTFQVYPVDTAGMEIMSFTDNPKQTSCRLAALDYPTIFVCYFGRTRGKIQMDSRAFLEDGLSDQLNPGSVLSITASGSNDLTGILFQSDKPIYLFCGTSSFETNNADFYQILSTEYLGRRYVTPSLLPNDDAQNKDLTLRIQAYQDNTKVTLKDSEDIITLKTAGDFEDRNLSTPYTIESNNKIAVALVIQDPKPGTTRSFIILAATSQNLTQSEVQVYIPLRASDIVYNGIEPETLKSFDVNGTGSHLETTDPEDQMCYYRVVETPGIAYTITVIANEDESKWLAFVGSMNFPVAMDLEICLTSADKTGDDEDNDCDGRKDEDECFSGYGVYGSDNDEDGGFNDDCLRNATTLPVLEKPPDPPCMPVNKPAGQCWKVSSNCKCSWVAALEAKEAMTKDERNVQIEADKERYKAELTLDTKKLSSSTSQRKSAGDKRQSAANVGYVGITFFAVLFGLIVLLDLKSLIRDFKTLVSNLKDGFGRLWDYINGE